MKDYLNRLKSFLSGKHIYEVEDGSEAGRLNEGTFKVFYYDFKNACLYSEADVANIGLLRVNFGIEGFESGLDFGEPAQDGQVAMSVTQSISTKSLNKGLAQIAQLNEQWNTLWPVLYETIMQTRKDYGRDTLPDASNTELQFQPPGIIEGFEVDYWTCDLQLTEFDGAYYVEFALDGEIKDSGVSF